MAMMRRQVVRQTSYKLAQQTPVMPPYGGGIAGEILPWQPHPQQQQQQQQPLVAGDLSSSLFEESLELIPCSAAEEGMEYDIS